MVDALRAILETAKQRGDEIREDRDRWAAPAQHRRSLLAFMRKPSSAA